MTKLTPLNAEQCALIDEYSRQAKNGELASAYWRWVYDGNNMRLISCTPAPAHPHYDTYCHWYRLLDSGEVAKGFWSIYTSVKIEGCLGTSGTTTEPKWFPEFDYEIRKTDKHPDNCKLALKLIDWANIPAGTMTNKGEFLGFYGSTFYGRHNAVLLNKMALIGSELDSLRLAEQTKFTHVQDGEAPPVIEGVVIEYKYLALRYKGTEVTHFIRCGTKTPNESNIIAYRILGLADGWTDDIGKVAV